MSNFVSANLVLLARIYDAAGVCLTHVDSKSDVFYCEVTRDGRSTEEIEEKLRELRVCSVLCGVGFPTFRYKVVD